MEEASLWKNISLDHLDFASDDPLKSSEVEDRELEVAQTALGNVRERFRSLTAQVEDLSAKYEAAQRDIQSSDKSLVRLSHQLHDRDKTIMALSEKIQEISLSKDQANFDYDRDLKAKNGIIDKLNTDIETLRQELSDAYRRLETSGVDLNHYKAELAKAISQMDVEKDQLEKLFAHLSHLAGQLKDQAEDYQVELGSLQDHLDILQRENDRLRREQTSSSSEVDSLRRQIVALEQVNSEVQRRYDLLKGSQKTLEASFQKVLIELESKDLKITSLEKELSALQDRIKSELEVRAQKDRQVESLTSELKIMQQRAARESEAAQLKRNQEIQDLEKMMEEARQQAHLEHSQYKEKAHEQIEDLESRLQDALSHLENLKRSEALYQIRQKKMTQRNSELEEEIKRLTIEGSEKESRVLELEREILRIGGSASQIDLLKEDLERAREEMANYLREKNELLAQLGSRNQEMERLGGALDEVKRAKAQAEESLKEMTEKLAKILAEKAELSEELRQMNARFGETLVGVRRDKALLEKNALSLKEKDAVISKLSEELLTAKNHLEKQKQLSHQESRRAFEQIEELKREIQSAGPVFQDLECLKKSLNQKEQELQVALEEVKNLQQAAERSRGDAQKLSQERELLKRREDKISGYLRAIDEEKGKVRHFCVKVLRRLQSAKTIHPMSQFLVVTEKEIARIEISLAKMPPLSADRARLEGEHERLIGQREFLKKILQEYDREAASQIEEFMSLTQSEELIPMPPPPPQEPRP